MDRLRPPRDMDALATDRPRGNADRGAVRPRRGRADRHRRPLRRNPNLYRLARDAGATGLGCDLHGRRPRCAFRRDKGRAGKGPSGLHGKTPRRDPRTGVGAATRLRAHGRAGLRGLHETLFHRQPDRTEHPARGGIRPRAWPHRQLYDRADLFCGRGRLLRLLPASLRALHGSDAMVCGQPDCRDDRAPQSARSGKNPVPHGVYLREWRDRQCRHGHRAIARHADGADHRDGRSQPDRGRQCDQCRMAPRPAVQGRRPGGDAKRGERHAHVAAQLHRRRE